MRYEQVSFTHKAATQAYRDNYDKAFPKRKKSKRVMRAKPKEK